MDYVLLTFPTYEDYLEKFIRPQDKNYLRNVDVCRHMVECGHCGVNAYTRRQFYVKRAEVQQHVSKKAPTEYIYSRMVFITDPVCEQFALREKKNTERSLSTIIFLSHMNDKGQLCSAYIDFEHSLRMKENGVKGAFDWRKIFSGEKKLIPKKTDLSYINWSSTSVLVNETANYKAIHNDKKGLKFMFKDDHKMIYVDPNFRGGRHSELRRTMCFSEKYGQVVLYDYHILKFAK